MRSTWSRGPSPRTARGIGIIGGGALLAGGLLAFVLWTAWRLTWINAEPLGDPLVGLNYSCNHAEYLLLETGNESVPDDRPGRAEWCAATLGEILSATGAKHLRLSVEWSQVEPRPGEYDFRLVDALLVEAARHDARVLLTIGIKAQRHPEYYVPQWLRDSVDLSGARVVTDRPEIREPALAMVRAVVAHVVDSPVIEAWGAENEPYVESHRDQYWNNWTVGRDFVQEIARIIRETDQLDRPITMNHGQHWATDPTWRIALADSDALGTSIYPFRNYSIMGWDMVVNILDLGPLGVNYANQARTAAAEGKELWVTELQAEPWSDFDQRLISPANPSPNLSPEKLAKNVEYGRRSGATRLYLWGAEWWLLQAREYGDTRWFEAGAAAIKAGEAGR